MMFKPKIYYDKGLKEKARFLRNNSTLTEVLLWNELKSGQRRGYDFHRQKPILHWIVDFFCYDLMLAIEVDGDYIVDTGHIVAFDETLDFTITKAGKSWISSMLGGEGLVCKFKGKGTVWCQSHNETSFGQVVGPKLRARK